MIEIKNAHKSLGEFSMRGIDLRIETGEYFVVLGPTGAGKSVLIESIAGLHRLDEGEVWIGGRNVTRVPTELRRVGYVPQDYVLFPHMTLRENIGFSLALRHTPAPETDLRVCQLAQLLNISHLLDRRPRTMSGGEQQRGALARALAPEPAVLLLDEPLSALDEGTRAELATELRRVSDEMHTTVVHVCHNFDEALELADRIAIVHQGRVLQVGTRAEVFRRPATAFVARFVGAQNLFPVLQTDRERMTVKLAEGVVLPAASPPEAAELLAMIRPEEIAVRPATSADPLQWTVGQVNDHGRQVRLKLQGPLPLQVTITPQAFAAAAVALGDSVVASWDPAAVHVLPA